MTTGRDLVDFKIAEYESRFPGRLNPTLKNWIQRQRHGLDVLISDPVWALNNLVMDVVRENKQIPYEHQCNRCGGWGGEYPTPPQRLSGWKGKLCPACRAVSPDGKYDRPPKCATNEPSSRESQLQSELTFAAELLGTADPEQKDCNGGTAVDALIRISRDSSAVVREGAVYGMARRTDVTIVREQLEKLAADDPSPVVRGAASDALATFREASATASRPGEELSNARLTIDALLRRLVEVADLSNRAQSELALFALRHGEAMSEEEASDASGARPSSEPESQVQDHLHDGEKVR